MKCRIDKQHFSKYMSKPQFNQNIDSSISLL